MRTTTLTSLLCAVLAAGGCKLFEEGDDGQPIGPDGGLGESCQRADDCAGNLVCIAGTCAVEGGVGVGGRCTANRDCVTGLQCGAQGWCAAAGGGAAGDACTSGGDCLRGLHCVLEGLGGTCAAGGTADVGETCAATTDCLAGMVCSSAGRCDRAADVYPPFEGVTCAPDAAPFRAHFEVPRPNRQPSDYFRLPFPNDLRVKADGGLDLTGFPRPGATVHGADLVTLHTDALADDFHGFSTVAPVTFRFSAPLDFATVQDPGALALVDVTDPAAADFGAARTRAFDYSSDRGKYVCQNALTLSNRMNDPLLPGHTYAAWVSTTVRSEAGGTPVQDPDLAAVLADTPPADASLMTAWTKHANFRTYLARNGRSAADVATVAIYTVGDPAPLLRQLATQLEAAPLPALTDLTLCSGGATSPCAAEGRACGDSSGAFWEIHGRMSVPRYQRGTPPFARPGDGGNIQFDDMFGRPIVQGTEQVCVALTVPKAVAPATGWPLVVHAHGTGGSFKAAIDSGIAAELASAPRPMATLTFEGIGHGARRGASTRSPDSLVFNVLNPVAARANHVQGAVDVMQALRVARLPTFNVAGAGAIDLDAARVYFFGHSQGATYGLPAVAASDFASAAVLSGAGSVLVEGLLNRTSPVRTRRALEELVGEAVGGGHPVMVLWQTWYDGVDPISLAPMLVRRPPAGVASKHVLATWGKGDSYTPESTLNNTAHAAGLAVAEPLVTGNGLPTDPRPLTPSRMGGDGQQRLAVQIQYDPAGAYDGHHVATRSPAAIADWKAFFGSLAAGAPSIP